MGIDIRRDISFLRRDRVKEGFMRKSSSIVLGPPPPSPSPPPSPPPSPRLDGLVIREGI